MPLSDYRIPQFTVKTVNVSKKKRERHPRGVSPSTLNLYYNYTQHNDECQLKILLDTMSLQTRFPQTPYHARLRKAEKCLGALETIDFDIRTIEHMRSLDPQIGKRIPLSQCFE